MRSFLFAVLAFLIFDGLAVAVSADSQDHVIMVSGNDPEMNAAIDHARATIGTFWRQFEHPDAGVGSFMLKVRISDANGTEYFWVVDIVRDGHSMTGTINNDAEIVKNVKLNERYTFTDADIADWGFVRNGRIVGNGTTRLLLKRMSRDEAKQYDWMVFEEP